MNSLLDAQTSVCLLLDELRLPRLRNKLTAQLKVPPNWREVSCTFISSDIFWPGPGDSLKPGTGACPLGAHMKGF